MISLIGLSAEFYHVYITLKQVTHPGTYKSRHTIIVKFLYLRILSMAWDTSSSVRATIKGFNMIFITSSAFLTSFQTTFAHPVIIKHLPYITYPNREIKLPTSSGLK
jgi:hypothetical protein